MGHSLQYSLSCSWHFFRGTVNFDTQALCGQPHFSGKGLWRLLSAMTCFPVEVAVFTIMVITIQVLLSKARLGYLDQELQSDRAQVEVESNTPDASWLNEALERFRRTCWGYRRYDLLVSLVLKFVLLMMDEMLRCRLAQVLRYIHCRYYVNISWIWV